MSPSVTLQSKGHFLSFQPVMRFFFTHCHWYGARVSQPPRAAACVTLMCVVAIRKQREKKWLFVSQLK